MQKPFLQPPTTSRQFDQAAAGVPASKSLRPLGLYRP